LGPVLPPHADREGSSLVSTPRQGGYLPTTWQEYRTTLCAHYLGTDWVTRVQHVLDTPQGWGQQQPNESIIAYHQRWKEVHDLYALGAASRIPPRVEIGFFISHLLPWYQELVDRRNTFLCMAPGAASGASTDTEDTEDIDSLVRFLTKAESNPQTQQGPPYALAQPHPWPSAGTLHGQTTKYKQRSPARILQPQGVECPASPDAPLPAAERPQTPSASPGRTVLLPNTAPLLQVPQDGRREGL
jgi:hypothetical protein